MPKMLELFAGSHSVTEEARRLGYTVLTLDIDGRSDITADIMNFDYTIWKPGTFDVVWASFPCEKFSNCRRCWIGRKTKYFGDNTVTKEMLDDDMEKTALPLLRKTEEIIDYLKPKYYFMENPQTGRAKDYLKHRPYYDVHYCMYDYPVKKPTRIWTNKTNFLPRRCNHKKDDHIAWRYLKGGGGGGLTRLDQRYSIPSQLLRELLL
jgi:site-specific DNA-cytosine methylase